MAIHHHQEVMSCVEELMNMCMQMWKGTHKWTSADMH